MNETDSDSGVQSYQGNDNALKHAQEQGSDVFDVPGTRFINLHMMSIICSTFTLVEYLFCTGVYHFVLIMNSI